MQFDRERAEAELAAITLLMRQPLTLSAVKDGWTDATWQKWRRTFEEVRDQVSKGQPVAGASITRAMDFDGVIGGEILERAAAVSKLLRSGQERSDSGLKLG